MINEMNNVYMSPESEADNRMGDLKERIRYFEKIRATMTGGDGRAGRVAVRPPAAITQKILEESTIKHYEQDQPTHNTKSKIELLKERFSKANQGNFANKERMEEVERLCKVKTRICDAVETESESLEKLSVISEKNMDSEEESLAEHLLATEAVKINIEEMISECNYGKIKKVEVNLPPTEDILDEIISAEMDSMTFLDLEEFDLKLKKKMVEMELEDTNSEGNVRQCPRVVDESSMCEQMIKESLTEASSTFSSNVCADGELGISSAAACEDVAAAEEDVAAAVNEVSTAVVSEASTEEYKLPRSAEILDDFYNFKTRPMLFKCAQLECLSKAQSMNLYTSCINKEYSNLSMDGMTITTPLFSTVHLKSAPVVFRAPGRAIEARPTVTVMNSVISEEGILYYFWVVQGNTSWVVIKDSKSIQQLTKGLSSSKNISIAERVNAMSDQAFYGFILSDITTTTFNRSSYVFYNGKNILLKFVGLSLCLCSSNKCIRMVKLNREMSKIHKLDGNENYSFVVDGIVFGCSCAKERDEWYSALESACL